jgi:hypothetical protein
MAERVSRERELLKRFMTELNTEEDVVSLFNDIKECLAQPEQEPEFNFDLERMKAAIESPISDVTGEELMRQVKSNRVFYQEGYAQAELELKREPLSDERLRDLSNSIHAHPDFDNVSVWQVFYIARAIEKAHGIGGGE